MCYVYILYIFRITTALSKLKIRIIMRYKNAKKNFTALSLAKSNFSLAQTYFRLLRFALAFISRSVSV